MDESPALPPPAEGLRYSADQQISIPTLPDASPIANHIDIPKRESPDSPLLPDVTTSRQDGLEESGWCCFWAGLCPLCVDHPTIILVYMRCWEVAVGVVSALESLKSIKPPKDSLLALLFLVAALAAIVPHVWLCLKPKKPRRLTPLYVHQCVLAALAIVYALILWYVWRGQPRKTGHAPRLAVVYTTVIAPFLMVHLFWGTVACQYAAWERKRLSLLAEARRSKRLRQARQPGPADNVIVTDGP
ncbi:unnamed protein product [Vitrella brassicaformis CCMP3155]|uniref:Uncharacterized protein n=1 Tax=Vitrella brassicaformis (strain CCMP3155) TaxID=1169540 RepID=A0A0G4GNP2_VITBC|nr:unnamed protein product [Vitrella brassicaformis CCMP3155]|eukprot:CEM31918.1 unnamed protein product [Vitrella brassicaformis CCMP3155]